MRSTEDHACRPGQASAQPVRTDSWPTCTSEQARRGVRSRRRMSARSWTSQGARCGWSAGTLMGHNERREGGARRSRAQRRTRRSDHGSDSQETGWHRRGIRRKKVVQTMSSSSGGSSLTRASSETLAVARKVQQSVAVPGALAAHVTAAQSTKGTDSHKASVALTRPPYSSSVTEGAVQGSVARQTWPSCCCTAVGPSLLPRYPEVTLKCTFGLTLPVTVAA
mmetsp:Transcript_8031/g.25674  ORF Transcript_8031/g.25674 Transcript_8031/m.25674 type:complete len:223 (-) Transcript_8031:14-682(-)